MTQVSDPLAHGQESVRDCSSSHRVVLLAGASVGHAEDEEVGESVRTRDVTEGVGDAEPVTEFLPEAKNAVSGRLGFWSLRGCCEEQRSLECRCKVLSLLRWSSFQGTGCG